MNHADRQAALRPGRVVAALVAVASAPGAMAPAARGGCENVFPRSAFLAGDNPTSVTTGDFNGDGNLDLAVANRHSDDVSILLGDGTGGFVGPTNFPTGFFSDSVTTADFDGDGHLDLAVATYDGVSILLGDGAGGFGGPRNFPAGDSPTSVTTGDFNGDGNLDLAVTNYGGPYTVGEVSILLGDGAGGFSAPSNFLVGIDPQSMATGDFDGDTNLDLAVAIRFSDEVWILLGDGTGGFVGPTNIPAGNGLWSVTTADLNGDGNLDLAVAGNHVSILLGDGTGGFGGPTNFPAGFGPRSVTTGNFDGDGNLDLAVANRASGDVSVLLGDGLGGFGAPSNFPAGIWPWSVVTDDFNGDGSPDVAVANSLSNDVSVLLGNGTGGFVGPSNFPAGDFPFSVTTGDFDRDGNLDLVVANLDSDDVSLLLGDGTGALAGPTNFPTGFSSNSVASADFDSDGNLDLAVTHSRSSSGVSILLGDGAGGFGAPSNFLAASAPAYVTTADLDGDGNADLALALPRSDNVSVLLGDGAGGFSAPSNFPAGEIPRSLTTGDFDGDGDLDLAVANGGNVPATGDVSILLGDGAGGFSRPTNFLAGDFPASVTTGDFDGNGNLDLAVTNVGLFTATGEVSILLGDGTGGFSRPTNLPAGRFPFSVTTGDFDRDGNADLALTLFTTDSVLVLLGDGTGGFAGGAFLAGDGPRSVTAGDFDGDGNLDLAVANGASDDVSLLLSQCIFGGPQGFPASGAANRLDVGDLDGDGDKDVIVVIPVIPGDAKARGGVQVLRNLGIDGFGEWRGLMGLKAVVTVGLQPSAVALGFLNADMHLDAAVTNAGDNTLMLLFNDGTGMLTVQKPPILVGDQPSAVAIADFTGDGFVDVAVANKGETVDQISIFANDGAGGFVLIESLLSGGVAALAVDPSDVDHDKDPDLAGIDQTALGLSGGVPGSVFVILNNPDGFGDAATHQVGVAPTDLTVGDLDLDGLPDIAVANGADGTLSILVNQGGGIFSTGTVLPVGDNPLSVEAADFDGDGDLDLAVVATDPDPEIIGPAIRVFENLGTNPGDLSFATPVTYSVDASPNFLASADFNRDGELDLVTVNAGAAAGIAPVDGSVTVLLNTRPPCPGDVNFDGAVGMDDLMVIIDGWGPCPPKGPRRARPCPGDIDGDGRVAVPDLLTLLARWGDCS